MSARLIALIAANLVCRLAFANTSTFPQESVHPADQNLAPVSCSHTADSLRCVQFLYNHDGDTLTVRVPEVHPLLGERISVRVLGIDTPEMYAPDACERRAAVIAQRLVKSLLSQAQRIDLMGVQRDKYFRILADVRFDGGSLAAHLLANGLAYPYDGGTKAKINWCEAAGVSL